ncbi:hypothetical protein U0070_024460 [Myodes glareolus]|uniref:Uncharacterized protein n=1 Tax=Myodes glareolus TaxID=447135 RepID=A0AAW0HRY2_MYOGA
MLEARACSPCGVAILDRKLVAESRIFMIQNFSPQRAALSGCFLELYLFLTAHELDLARGDMDESSVMLSTIDVSYLPSSSEYSLGRCKHTSEDWGDCGFKPTFFRSATLKWKESLLSRKRPFVGRCCYSCTPQSWERFFNPSIPSLGLRNVIYINETHTR